MSEAIEQAYNVKRLALIFAVQAEIEGMKASNSQRPTDQVFEQKHFDLQAERLRNIAYAHNEQL